MKTRTTATLLLLSAVRLSLSYAEQEEFVFTQELLRLTEYSLRLSNIAYNTETFYEDAALTIYRDEPDQALVTKLGDQCFAAFRGTVFHRWDDWMQNTMMGDSTVCSQSGNCCDVQSGHFQAYFETNYHHLFHDKLMECLASCPDGACPLVLTGHSQG